MGVIQFEQGDGPNARLQVLLQNLSRQLSGSSASQEALNTLAEARQVVDGQDAYLEKVTSPAPPIVFDMLKASDQEDWAGAYQRGETKFPLLHQMSAGTYEASVMMQIARLTGAKRILEIGMFTGTTTAAMASLDSVEKIVALDIEPYLERWVQPWFEKGQVAHKIQVGIADGQEGLKDLSKQGQSFDLVFIDADKPGYAAYYDLLFSHHLLSPNATIVADNTAFRGVPWVPSEAFGQENGTAMAQFNDKIHKDSRVHVTLLSIRDGMSIIKLK